MRLDGKGLGHTLMPDYFYTLTGITEEQRPRWVDEFANDSNLILLPGKHDSRAYVRAKNERNEAYSRWVAAFFHTDPVTKEYVPWLKGSQMKWQAIRVLHDTHSETNRGVDWWPNYRDALFRVFLQPQTIYDHKTGEHKQWYLLCPEDCYLLNRQEIKSKGGTPPSRNYSGNEKYLSADPNLRRARLIPVECAHHLRNEGSEYKSDL